MSSDKPQLTRDEAEELIEAFEIFDRNGDGSISKDELGPVLRALGQNPTEAEIQMLLEKADIDGNGKISQEEYVALIKDFVKDPKQVEKELYEALTVFDKKGTGKLHVKQLRIILKNLGEPLSDIEIEAILKTVKKTKKGLVDIKQIASMLCQKY